MSVPQPVGQASSLSPKSNELSQAGCLTYDKSERATVRLFHFSRWIQVQAGPDNGIAILIGASELFLETFRRPGVYSNVTGTENETGTEFKTQPIV